MYCNLEVANKFTILQYKQIDKKIVTQVLKVNGITFH